MKVAILLIRLMVGLIFIVHGSQKVFSGFEDSINMMANLGFPEFTGILLGLVEFIGGILMLIGVFTNYVGIAFITIMVGALFNVHLKEGFSASEFVISLLVMNISIILSYKWNKLLQFY